MKYDIGVTIHLKNNPNRAIDIPFKRNLESDNIRGSIKVITDNLARYVHDSELICFTNDNNGCTSIVNMKEVTDISIYYNPVKENERAVETMQLDKSGHSKCVLGKDMPSDSSLMAMRKAELVSLIHIAQHNYEVILECCNNLMDENKCNRCPLGGEKHD